jgi:bifunctional UDP-N-acetylglucosamine pyrophosphorylase/glucosamine-1-phosphate N-acetyltransferase
MRNQIVILAAGKGTRMGGSLPKVLVMLKNKPLILHLLEQVEKVNHLIKPIVVVGYKANMVKTVLGDDYIYAFQEQQLGTAHALMTAKKYVKGKNILVLYGDHPFIKAKSLSALMKLHHQKNSNISMFTTTVPNFLNLYKPFKSFGRIIRGNSKKIIKILEYKDASINQQKIKELNPGLYMFNSAWLWKNLDKIKNQNAQGEYYLTDIVELAITSGEKIHSLPIDPKEVVGVNSKEDLTLAENF